MTDVLERIEERLAAASERPWVAIPPDRIAWLIRERENGPQVGTAICAEDAAFIATARNLFPELLAVVRAAERVSDPYVRDGGGSRWWTAHDELDAALAAFRSRAEGALA